MATKKTTKTKRAPVLVKRLKAAKPGVAPSLASVYSKGGYEVFGAKPPVHDTPMALVPASYVPTPAEAWEARCYVEKINDLGQLEAWVSLNKGYVRNGQGVLAAVQARREALR